MELLPWINETRLDWERLSRNPNAIELLRENTDKIDWRRLSLNPNAIELLRENPDKIDWRLLSRNLKGLRPFQTHGRARETAKRCLYKCD
jgi:uncharacterized protein YlzI (FlbEa/FlbD family)